MNRKSRAEMTGIEIVLTAVCGLLGGCNVLQLVFLRQTRRRYSAEADKAGADAGQARLNNRRSAFDNIVQVNEFLSRQLDEKERRFAEQTELVRRLNHERIEDSEKMLELTKRYGELELREQKYHCEVRGCASRKPPNGY